MAGTRWQGNAGEGTRRASMPAPSLVSYSVRGAIAVVTIERPEVRNAVDQPTRQALAEAFRQFEGEPAQSVAVLTGAGGAFCAGADLKARAAGQRKPYGEDGDGPMGPTRMKLSKPVIAAIEGPAVAGGLELRAVVRPARGRAQCHTGRVLPALRRAPDRPRHDSPAAIDRA